MFKDKSYSTEHEYFLQEKEQNFKQLLGEIILLILDVKFSKTWPCFKKCLEKGHIFENANFLIPMQRYNFTQGMSDCKKKFFLKNLCFSNIHPYIL